MMYQQKLVAAIKVNGRILRERGGVVNLPFGSEYSVFLKNLNTVRAKVKIGVDGAEATGGTWLVISPNSVMELERFIRDGNFSSGNRFKFIERTADVEAHRGIKADDGIVRIEFAMERRVVDVPIVREHYYDEWYPRPHYPRWPDRRWPHYDRRMRGMSAGTQSRSMGNVQSSSTSNYAVPTAGAASAGAADFMSYDEAGITVAGSISHQQFHAVQDFPTDQSDVMMLHLRGIVRNVPIGQPITVQTKLSCGSCGLTSGSDMAFCPRCGTALALV